LFSASGTVLGPFSVGTVVSA
jgi:hypothetical protein